MFFSRSIFGNKALGAAVAPVRPGSQMTFQAYRMGPYGQTRYVRVPNTQFGDAGSHGIVIYGSGQRTANTLRAPIGIFGFGGPDGIGE